MLDQIGVASLPGSVFGFKPNQLFIRLAFTDFNGTQFLKKIKNVAVCGGSGSFLLKDAIRAGADIFITGDFKYHQFFDAEGRIIIADIGHFESEQYTKELFYVKFDYIST